MKKLEKFSEENTEGKMVNQIEEIIKEINATNLKKTKTVIMEKLSGQLKDVKDRE